MKRLLLDENLPRQLKGHFSAQFEVVAVPDLGWQSKKNGELLVAMEEAEFKYLLTADQNLIYQQNLEKYSIIVVVLSSIDNRLKSFIPFVSKIEMVIMDADPTLNMIEIDLRKS